MSCNLILIGAHESVCVCMICIPNITHGTHTYALMYSVGQFYDTWSSVLVHILVHALLAPCVRQASINTCLI